MHLFYVFYLNRFVTCVFLWSNKERKNSTKVSPTWRKAKRREPTSVLQVAKYLDVLLLLFAAHAQHVSRTTCQEKCITDTRSEAPRAAAGPSRPQTWNLIFHNQSAERLQSAAGKPLQLLSEPDTLVTWQETLEAALQASMDSLRHDMKYREFHQHSIWFIRLKRRESGEWWWDLICNVASCCFVEFKGWAALCQHRSQRK